MKFNKLFAVALLAAALVSCENDKKEETTETPKGTLTLKFDNFFGTDDMELSSVDDTTTYNYQNKNSQDFNITRCGYFITNIKLEGPNGELQLDQITSSADANKVKGFYYVDESDFTTQTITLQDIKEGTYNKITFNVGIPATAVQQGAQGGVLDPANELSIFWGWNSGYVGLVLEGLSPASPQKADVNTPKYKVRYHIGGWKDEGNFVNNVQSVSLSFPESVEVIENLTPKAHIVVDFKKLLDMANIDFSSQYSIHMPASGASIAAHIGHMFSVEHVHAN